MSEHFLKKCENGHILAQCKCIGPKKETIVPLSECSICARGEQPKFPVGTRILFKNFDGRRDPGEISAVQGDSYSVKWDDGFVDFDGFTYIAEDFLLEAEHKDES
jgi:hypothetical protein